MPQKSDGPPQSPARHVDPAQPLGVLTGDVSRVTFSGSLDLDTV